MFPITGMCIRVLLLVPLHRSAVTSVVVSHLPRCPRSLNVDMEWLYGASESSNMEVDIGYLPQVQLQCFVLQTIGKKVIFIGVK